MAFGGFSASETTKTRSPSDSHGRERSLVEYSGVEDVALNLLGVLEY